MCMGPPDNITTADIHGAMYTVAADSSAVIVGEEPSCVRRLRRNTRLVLVLIDTAVARGRGEQTRERLLTVVGQEMLVAPFAVMLQPVHQVAFLGSVLGGTAVVNSHEVHVLLPHIHPTLVLCHRVVLQLFFDEDSPFRLSIMTRTRVTVRENRTLCFRAKRHSTPFATERCRKEGERRRGKKG